MTEQESQEIVLKGLGVAPGICIGKAYLVDKEGVNVVKKYYIAESDLHKEENRFKSAVSKSRHELCEIIQETPRELRQHTAILETHIVLLQDKLLYGRTLDTIQRFSIQCGMGSQERRRRAESHVPEHDRALLQGARRRHRPCVGPDHAAFGGRRRAVSLSEHR